MQCYDQLMAAFPFKRTHVHFAVINRDVTIDKLIISTEQDEITCANIFEGLQGRKVT